MTGTPAGPVLYPHIPPPITHPSNSPHPQGPVDATHQHTHLTHPSTKPPIHEQPTKCSSTASRQVLPNQPPTHVPVFKTCICFSVRKSQSYDENTTQGYEKTLIAIRVQTNKSHTNKKRTLPRPDKEKPKDRFCRVRAISVGYWIRYRTEG